MRASTTSLLQKTASALFLPKKTVQEVVINAFSPDVVWWNLRLVGATILLGSLGITPYIYLILYTIPEKPFQETWLFPILRIAGSAIVAVDIQLLFQLRILEETYYRLRFLAADHYIKDTGKSLPVFWDPNRRSKSVFTALRRHFNTSGSGENQGVAAGIPARTLDKRDADMFLKDIHAMGTFTKFSNPSQPPPQTSGTGAIPTGLTHRRSPARASTRDVQHAEEGNTVHKHWTTALTSNILLFCAQHLTTLGLILTQIFLFVGGLLIIVGYIGCFGIVQANRSPGQWKGPLIWIIGEVVLVFVRTAVWSWNPPWDDPKSPIVLEKDLTLGPTSQGKDGQTPLERTASYGIGWSLDSVTADDMHALIIGIDDYKHCNPEDFPVLTGAKADGERVKEYLEDKLLVPPRQIRTLFDSAATKDKIVERNPVLYDTESASLLRPPSLSSTPDTAPFPGTQPISFRTATTW
ncbi:hypothetical protein FA13DRAFT_891195 [Coprinellus micaceus]|uniref:Uncharacterized protein n=1 Tax=Coprinellus micaceus TaxID=71717 RepID=A0A4Y7TUH0_COPMI|nr:hypothetical protein FA13DRAFT_891195 [Coprinellus micaceus]